ncbi:MAG: aldo/keto reductase [Clostridia bacterium]|nr:aldo/keto reductase [Clostridia bacterium]
MQYSNFDSIGRKISKLGFGLMRLPKLRDGEETIDREEAFRLVDLAIKSGVNYFDTAYVYHGGDSEAFAKEALGRYPRDSYCLATKLPGWVIKEKGKHTEELFNEQLEKCGVDYFDFYLLHAVNRDVMAVFEGDNSYEYLKKQKEAGKIKHLGFSYHGDLEFFIELLDKYEWDFAQLQINYYDWEATDAKSYYKALEERNIPCIIMEPVRGGSLHTLNEDAKKVFEELGDASAASYALRYDLELPAVLTILSGMSTYEQVEDNIKTFTEAKPLTAEEKEAIEKANVLFRQNFAIPCTDCKYCVETCPAGVNIPACFTAYNEYNKTRDTEDFKKEYALIPDEKRAHNCIECGACTKHCPQQIKIPDQLKKVGKLAK